MPLIGVSADELLEDSDQLADDAPHLCVARSLRIVGNLGVAGGDDLVVVGAGAEQDDRDDRRAAAHRDLDHAGGDGSVGTEEAEELPRPGDVPVDGDGDQAVLAQSAIDLAQCRRADASCRGGIPATHRRRIDGDDLHPQTPTRGEHTLEETRRLQHLRQHGHAAEAVVPPRQAQLPRPEVEGDAERPPSSLQRTQHVLDVDGVNARRHRVGASRHLHDVDPAPCQVTRVVADHSAAGGLVGLGEDMTKVVAQPGETARLEADEGAGEGCTEAVGEAVWDDADHRLGGAVGAVGERSARSRAPRRARSCRRCAGGIGLELRTGTVAEPPAGRLQARRHQSPRALAQPALGRGGEVTVSPSGAAASRPSTFGPLTAGPAFLAAPASAAFSTPAAMNSSVSSRATASEC